MFSRCFFSGLICLILVFVTACAGNREKAVPQKKAKTTTEIEPDLSAYLGVVHPPMPARVDRFAGVVALAPGQDAADAEYAFDDVEVGSIRMLWLSKLQSRKVRGQIIWRVVDVLRIPELGPDELFQIGNCSAGNLTSVAAILPYQDTEVLTHAIRAWTIDRQNKKIIEIEPSNVECQNEIFSAP